MPQSFFLTLYLFIFREREKDGEREGKKLWSVRETLIGCLSHAPKWGLDPQPRHVLWLGIELAAFWSPDWCSIHWATQARAHPTIFWLCRFRAVLRGLREGVNIRRHGSLRGYFRDCYHNAYYSSKRSGQRPCRTEKIIRAILISEILKL